MIKFNISTWNESECQIKETKFFFDKMGAIEGNEVAELIRYELSKTNSPSLAKSDALESEQGADIFRAILSLHPNFVKKIRGIMFQHVRFTNKYALTPQMVAGAEDTAFGGLGLFSIYQILGRALVVNFLEYFQEFQSQVTGDKEVFDTNQSPQETLLQ